MSAGRSLHASGNLAMETLFRESGGYSTALAGYRVECCFVCAGSGIVMSMNCSTEIWPFSR